MVKCIVPGHRPEDDRHQVIRGKFTKFERSIPEHCASGGKRNANNTNFQFWQQNNHDEELFTQMLRAKLDYLHSNPVKAGIVREPQHYVYSSAFDYFTNQKGMIEIDDLQVW